MDIISGEFSLLSGVRSQNAVRFSTAVNNHADPAPDLVFNEKRWRVEASLGFKIVDDYWRA